MGVRFNLKKILFVLIIGVLQTDNVFAQENNVWVQTSWVEVHKGAASDSPVKSHLVVNSQVQILDKNNEWCHVKLTSIEDGYALCSLLGKEKIIKAKDPMMYFWMEPSLSSWEAAGKYLEKSLSEEERNAEFDDGHPRRYSVPEFDAMKNKMREGFSVTDKIIFNRFAWQAEYEHDGSLQVPIGDAKSIFQQLKDSGAIAKLKPSFFKQERDLLVIDYDLPFTVDKKISLSNGTAKVTEVGPAERYGDNNYNAIGNFWDVGKIDIELTNPIYFHKIARNGLVEVLQESHARIDIPNGFCGDQAIYESSFGKKLKDYPSVKDSLINFYLSAPLTQRTLKVFTSLRKMKGVNDGVTSVHDVLIYEIDLNQDSIFDLMVVSYGSSDHAMGGLKTVWDRYANVNGEWLWINQSYEQDCT